MVVILVIAIYVEGILLHLIIVCKVLHSLSLVVLRYILDTNLELLVVTLLDVEPPLLLHLLLVLHGHDEGEFGAATELRFAYDVTAQLVDYLARHEETESRSLRRQIHIFKAL